MIYLKTTCKARSKKKKKSKFSKQNSYKSDLYQIRERLLSKYCNSNTICQDTVNGIKYINKAKQGSKEYLKEHKPATLNPCYFAYLIKTEYGN